jgi:low temperature requirement protein LtrA
VTHPRVNHEQGATFVELFFDLVFVYAVTQLTAFVLHDLTWSGVGRALVLFWLVWWAWTQFTWALNLADTEHVWIRVPTLAATALTFFLAQSLPAAYGQAGLWFAVSYALSRLVGIGVQLWVLWGEDSNGRAGGVSGGLSLGGIAFVLAGGFVDGELRVALWAAAMAADLVTVAFTGRERWDLSAEHFAERHGLIVIIALGESLIGAGIATTQLTRDLTFAATASGAVIATCALWWTYFGGLHAALEERLSAQDDDHRVRFARDVFSLGHAAAVAGVIGIAVGFEIGIGQPEDPIEGPAALAFTIGVLLFVGGLAAAAARAGVRAAVGPRIAMVAMVLAATPLIPMVTAAVTFWGLATLATSLAIWETRHHAGAPDLVTPIG